MTKRLEQTYLLDFDRTRRIKFNISADFSYKPVVVEDKPIVDSNQIPLKRSRHISVAVSLSNTASPRIWSLWKRRTM